MTSTNNEKGKSKQQYTPEFKAQVVRLIFRENKNINQLAIEHDIRPAQLYRWRDIAIQGLPSLFARTQAGEQDNGTAEHEEQLHDLYAEIGRLSTELARLKRMSG